jgi:GNAT superfamily N-acetyltransferase
MIRGMTASADIEFQSHDVRNAPDSVLQALHALEAAFETEFRPDEPPTPFETYRARCRSMPNYYDSYATLAVEGGEVVAATTIDIDRTGDNAHILEAWTVVSPAARRRGIARQLLEFVVDVAGKEDRTLLFGYTGGSVPSGAAFLQRLGADAGLVERESELDLAALDHDLVQRWLAEGPTRASGYELVLIEEDIPEDLLEAFSELHVVTNTAPRDNLEMEDEHRTPDQLRESDRSRRESGSERILCLSRQRDTGALAGWTELAWHPAQPWKIHQYWTAVHPDHRGVALGKWLKAANVVRALERWPEGTKIVTGNAYSNDAMLGINNALGFRETAAWTVWQVPVTKLVEYLQARA